jgi:hypothetical protein
VGWCISSAAVATIAAGAPHFMISTHAGEVVGVVAQHMAQAEEKAATPAN